MVHIYREKTSPTIFFMALNCIIAFTQADELYMKQETKGLSKGELRLQQLISLRKDYK